MVVGHHRQVRSWLVRHLRFGADGLRVDEELLREFVRRVFNLYLASLDRRFAGDSHGDALCRLRFDMVEGLQSRVRFRIMGQLHQPILRLQLLLGSQLINGNFVGRGEDILRRRGRRRILEKQLWSS